MPKKKKITTAVYNNKANKLKKAHQAENNYTAASKSKHNLTSDPLIVFTAKLSNVNFPLTK